MGHETDGCGELHDLYTTVRDGDLEAAREHWNRTRSAVAERDEEIAEEIDARLASGETAAVRQLLAELVFVDEEDVRLDGTLATIVGTLLYGFGYAAAHVLFVGADSREAVKSRLRWAYRTVGVDIQATESVDGTERTVFRCPYRNIAAESYGQRRVCHDILDRVDDGYVTYLDRHRDLEYDRPRPCAGGACCYSEVTEQ